jgi:hypothetical protein
MAEPVPAASDVSAGTYSCTRCGYEIGVRTTRHLPLCGVRQRVVEHGSPAATALTTHTRTDRPTSLALRTAEPSM